MCLCGGAHGAGGRAGGAGFSMGVRGGRPGRAGWWAGDQHRGKGGQGDGSGLSTGVGAAYVTSTVLIIIIKGHSLRRACQVPYCILFLAQGKCAVVETCISRGCTWPARGMRVRALLMC